MEHRKKILIEVLRNIKAIDHGCYSMAQFKMSKRDVLNIVYEIENYLVKEIEKCNNKEKEGEEI
jgi:hypothetical protein